MAQGDDETVEPGRGRVPARSVGAGGEDAPTRLPASIGNYEILALLGRGGMGVVYRAQQARPHRQVALKVIASTYVSPELLRRFELESETLGRLRHPGIAQVYEAGTAPDQQGGVQAYFAMELIEGGRPLDEFVAAAKLDVPARLRLLCAICDAVQHAHQQGVIHRDLKPDNVMVTPDGEPKILDFGVARVTGSDVRATTLHTDVGQIIGTLPYMSPEQAAGDPTEVDTRADIYALGVIGYELLAGRRPLALERRALVEAVRIIREDEPDRLSSINRRFRGDVETIIGKALAKEKSRRYASANDLAADVRRYLSDEPIAARPPSARYQLAKFTRRHRALVVGAGITLVTLIGGIIGSSWFAYQADRQRSAAVANSKRADAARADADAQRVAAERSLAEANALAHFMSDDVFGNATATSIPDRAVRDTIVRVMLGPAVASARVRFADQPLVRATMFFEIGFLYQHLGRTKEAEALFRDAADARRERLGANAEQTIEAENGLATTLLDGGDFGIAERMFRDVAARANGSLGLANQQTLVATNGLAATLLADDRAKEAEPLFKIVCDARVKLNGEAAEPSRAAMSQHAVALASIGRLPEAIQQFDRVMTLDRVDQSKDTPNRIERAHNFAMLLSMDGQDERARPMIADAWSRSSTLLGPDHPYTLKIGSSRARNLWAVGRKDDAADAYEDLHARRRRTLGADHPLTLETQETRALLLSGLARYEAANDLYDDALARRLRLSGPDDPSTIKTAHDAATCLIRSGRADDAERVMRPIVLSCVRNHKIGPTHPITVRLIGDYSDLLAVLGRRGEAAELRRAFHVTAAPTTRATSTQAAHPTTNRVEIEQFVASLIAAATAPTTRPSR